MHGLPDFMDRALNSQFRNQTEILVGLILQGFEWGFLEVERKEYESQNTH